MTGDAFPIISVRDLSAVKALHERLGFALTLTGRDRQPLTVGLANLSSPHLARENLVAAGSILAILPPMLLFAMLNRYYVRGLFAGATKG